MAFIRRVRTASGATAVQIAAYRAGRQEVVKHDMRKRIGVSVLFVSLLGESVQPLGIKDKITDTVRLRRGVRTHSGPPVETGEIVTNTPAPCCDEAVAGARAVLLTSVRYPPIGRLSISSRAAIIDDH